MEVFLINARVFSGSSGSSVYTYNQGSYLTREGITIGNGFLFENLILIIMVQNDNNTKAI